MAYFSNGSEAECAVDECRRLCANWRDGCVILDLHCDWNYEAVGADADKTKKETLEALWPTIGPDNGECRLFREHPTMALPAHVITNEEKP